MVIHACYAVKHSCIAVKVVVYLAYWILCLKFFILFPGKMVQILSAAEPSIQHTTDKGTEDIAKREGKGDLWKPLNVLVEAASKTKANKSNSRGTVGRPVLLDAHDNDPTPRTKLKECGNTSKVQGNENDTIPGSSGSARPRKSLGRPKKAAVAVSEGLNISAQAVVDTHHKFDGRFGPIWFSLVASDEQ